MSSMQKPAGDLLDPHSSSPDGDDARQPAPPDYTKDLPELPDPAEVGEAG